LLSDSLLLPVLLLLVVLCLIVVSFGALSVLLRVVELLPEDCCLVVLAGSAALVDCEPEEVLELTVSDDLLLVTVLCPEVEFVLALLFTVVVDLFTVVVDLRALPLLP